MRFEPNVDRETRSLRARARSANPDGELLPGAFADVELAIREIEDALTVPAIAIIPSSVARRSLSSRTGWRYRDWSKPECVPIPRVQVIRGLEATRQGHRVGDPTFELGAASA